MELRSLARRAPTAIVLIAVVAMALYGPIDQLAHYNEYADRRAWLGIPNAADVLSNLGFALVAFWGFAILRTKETVTPRAAAGWWVFFAALAFTALGSSYYHWAPDNDRLICDRVAIALACAGLLAAMRAETRDTPQSPWVLPALIAAAIASVVWWKVSASLGMEDLRPYLLLQGAPLLLVPLWQAGYGSPRADRVAFGIAIALYVAAKIVELNDAAIFAALGFVSGHTIKHLLAVVAAAVIAANLAARRNRRAPGYGFTLETPRAST
jgi:hypothetical protein